jgi:hypothetical protein
MLRKLEPYRIRLACRPVNFRKHWDAFKPLGKYPISPALKSDEKDLDVAWSRGNWIPRVKHAALVLDREHGGKIRVLDGGSQIFSSFQAWSDLTKKNPAGPSAPDFLIMVKKVKKGERTQTEYKVIADPEGIKPFTAEELSLMGKTTMSRDWLINKIYKKSTPEEIKMLYEKLPDDRKICKIVKSDKPFQKDEAPPRTVSSGIKVESEEQVEAEEEAAGISGGDEPPEEGQDVAAPSVDGDGDDQPAQLF